MKTLFKVFTLILIYTGTWITPQKVVAQGVSVSFQVFYDNLSPYGTWVESPNYGYVWVPDVGPGFTPYGTNGYWIYTDFGWTWVSYYPWGWAPFHYGRWYIDPVYGPVWVPDYEWGPGWVIWRRSEGYYGWAPIGPGISISIAYSSGYIVPTDRWVFVRDNDFGSRNINYVDRSRNVTIINNSTVINNVREDRSRNTKYIAGPDRAEVQQRSGKAVAPVTIKESSRPGQKVGKNELQLYRPQIQKSTAAEPKPAPSKVARSFKEIKSPVQKDNSKESQPQNKRQEDKQQPLQPKQINHQEGQVEKQQPIKQQPKQREQPDKQPVQPRKIDRPQEQRTQPRSTEQPFLQRKNQGQLNQQPQQRPALQQQPQRKQSVQPNPIQQRNNQPQRQQSNPPQNRGRERPR